MAYTANEKRYDTMEYKRSGTSGLKLPKISLGLWQNFGENADYSVMKDICLEAFDLGINHFDLANNYGPRAGAAEINFSKILKDSLMPYRDELLISTKAGYDMWAGPYGRGGSRKYLISSLDQSLSRMGLDYVDIFYHHCMDKNTPVEESMMALDSIVKSGKALYAGISNYDGKTMKEATDILNELKCPFIINQNRYSMIDRRIETNGLREMAGKEGKGIIAFSPLGRGLLTNKYLKGIPSDSEIKVCDVRLCTDDALRATTLEKINALNDIASERGQTLAQMALAWVLNSEEVTSVLIGASRASQVTENVKTLDNLSFTSEELAAIDKITIGAF